MSAFRRKLLPPSSEHKKLQKTAHGLPPPPTHTHTHTHYVTSVQRQYLTKYKIILNKTGTYKVTVRRVRATFVAVRKRKVLHILSVVCGLRYPACNANEPYCHLWPVRHYYSYPHYLVNKGKAVPLQARNGPGGSRKLRFPDFMTTAQDGGKVVSLTHRPPLPPGNTPGTHFC